MGEEGPPGVYSQLGEEHRGRRATREGKIQEPTEGKSHCSFSPHPNPGSQTCFAYPSMVEGWREEMTPQPDVRDKGGSALRVPRGSPLPGWGLNTIKGRPSHPAPHP